MASVVHVDNSAFFRKQMKVFLAGIGFECEGFGLGREALDGLSNGGVSYAIIGLELADMKGEEFVQRVSEIASHIPVIVVTSHEDEERTAALEALGVEAVLVKSGNWKGELNHLLN